MYYTYVLQSEIDGQFYTGYSKDLKLRFDQHQKGQVESTKGRLPLKLIYYEACLSKEDAQKRESYFKTYNGKRFLHKRLKSYLTGWKGWRKRRYKAVFLNKLTDSGQEAAETQTWLEFSFHCKYINEETFNRLDESYEHIFAMLNSMEKKADTFCRPSS